MNQTMCILATESWTGLARQSAKSRKSATEPKTPKMATTGPDQARMMGAPRKRPEWPLLNFLPPIPEDGHFLPFRPIWARMLKLLKKWRNPHFRSKNHKIIA